LILLASSFVIGLWKRRGIAGRQPPFYQVTTLLPENRVTAAAISPDGKWIAYANVDGIFLRAMRNGETRALRAPVDFVIDRLAWFADTAKLVASGFSAHTYVPDIWIISIAGAPPLLLRSMARQGCPSPDGTRIAFTSADQSSIWTMKSNGANAKQVLGGAAGDSFPVLFWSATARRLGFVRRHYSAKNDHPSRSLLRYYQRDYESLALDVGKVPVRVPDL
jgi:Tol biopolymer transport system component